MCVHEQPARFNEIAEIFIFRIVCSVPDFLFIPVIFMIAVNSVISLPGIPEFLTVLIQHAAFCGQFLKLNIKDFPPVHHQLSELWIDFSELIDPFIPIDIKRISEFGSPRQVEIPERAPVELAFALLVQICAACLKCVCVK